MKKIFSLVSALALCAVAFASTKVSMDFADPTAYGFASPAAGSFTQLNTGDVIAKDGVSLTVTFASGSGFRFYNSSGKINLRGYVNSTLTIAPPTGKKLLRISANATNMNSTYISGDMTGTLWEGEADAVTFNVIKSTLQINTLTIDFGDAGEVPPTVVVDTIGVTEAIARIKAGNKGECYVKGVVAGDPFQLGNNGPAFYMTDIANPSDSLEGFKINKDANTVFADVDDMAATLAMGDTILIYAAGLDKYNNIYETTSGYFVRTIGKSDAIILPWNIADATYENGNWTITIAATNDVNPSDALKLIFPSSETKGIAGFHTLATGSAIKKAGVSLAITSGDVKLTFKSISNNNYNEYDVKMTGLVGESVYRLNNTMEIPAFDAAGEEIVLSADRPFVPKDNDTITCAQAREYALSLGSGESSPMTVTVRGFITDMFSNGVTFWMDDKAGDAKTIEAYSCTMPVGVSLDNGAEVYVTGLLKNYNGTPEVDHGTVSVISGGSQIVAQEVTVAEAVAVAQALAANATSEGYYAITGYISGIAYEYSAQYGNISLWMSDTPDDSQTFQAYRAKCDAAIADKLVVGAKVKVTDKIKHFHQDATEGEDPKPEKTVYETYGGGEVILLSGAGVEDINVNAPAVKFIENGRIIILRNGVRYDVQGRIAE